MSQKFVPLISCTTSFDQHFILHEIFRRCLFLYRVHVFRISVNVMPFLFVCFFFYHILQPLRHGRDTACRPTDDPFSAFLSPVAQEPVRRQNNICLVQSAEKKYILGIHPKKIIIPASFHSKAFVILCKFETSWALIGRLSRGFFAISGASNFKHFKQLFMTLLFGLLTM